MAIIGVGAYKAVGNPVAYKARLVAQGIFPPPAGVPTYASMASYDTVRASLAFAMHKRYYIEHYDILSAFINAPLSDVVYVEQPEGFIDRNHPDYVWRLKKAMYGLPQAPNTWTTFFGSKLHELGYKTTSTPSLFLRFSSTGEVIEIIIVFVDDIIGIFKHSSQRSNFLQQLQQFFKVTHSKLHNLLGMDVAYEHGHYVHLSSVSFMDGLLKEYKMMDANPAPTPMIANQTFTTDSTTVVDFPMASLIGSLNYLVNTTRPDIGFATRCLSQFVTNFNQQHITAAYRILKYLKGTKTLGLLYEQGEDMLHGFSDASYASMTDNKSQTGCLIYISPNSSPVSWKCEKQTATAVSTLEAEGIALFTSTIKAHSAAEKFSSMEGDMIEKNIVVMLCDNQPLISLIEGDRPITASHRAISTKLQVLRDWRANGTLLSCEDVRYHHPVLTTFVPTTDNLADFLTKALPVRAFNRFLNEILKECPAFSTTNSSRCQPAALLSQMDYVLESEDSQDNFEDEDFLFI